MQAQNWSENDRVSMGAHDVHFTKIGSWLEALKFGKSGSRLHLERIQEDVLEEAEFDVEDFDMTAEDGDDASFSFDIDDFVYEPATDTAVPEVRRGRKALDLGSRPSIDFASLLKEEAALSFKEQEGRCGNAGKIVDKFRQLGLAGVATMSILALVFKH